MRAGVWERDTMVLWQTNPSLCSAHNISLCVSLLLSSLCKAITSALCQDEWNLEYSCPTQSKMAAVHMMWVWQPSVKAVGCWSLCAVLADMRCSAHNSQHWDVFIWSVSGAKRWYAPYSHKSWISALTDRLYYQWPSNESVPEV